MAREKSLADFFNNVIECVNNTCGMVRAGSYDINGQPHDFVHILIGITSASNETLGFDTLIAWERQFNGKTVGMKTLDIWERNTKFTVELDRVLFISDNLFGRGTTVWGGIIRDKRSETGGQVAVKDSRIDPLQKYTEGRILSILNVHEIEGVPTLIHEQQVKAPSLATIANPLPVGALITEFSCLGELLVAFLDYVVAHKNAVEVTHILHHDISLFNLFLASMTQRSDHKSFVERITGLSTEAQVELCRRIAKLKRWGVLGDWGYTVPTSEHSSTANLDADHSSDAGDPPTSPIEMVSQTASKTINCVYIVPVSLQNAEPRLVSISDLTRDDDIVMAMGPQSKMESDLCETIDSCPLYRTGTWSWMSAQLVMAGAGKPVVHELVHDLESLFYVLVGICVFLDSPSNLKCKKDLAQCFDKYFNTFKPSVLKTITIQSDITWTPFILQHVSKYFKPIIPLLTQLHDAVIIPLFFDNHSNVTHRKPFTHDMFITNIIEMLSHLGPDACESGNNNDYAYPEMKVEDELADGTKEASPPPDSPGRYESTLSTLGLCRPRFL
ncbi:hypothetical protein EDD15DRAFT_2373882 [Pisolithus albus]|nr:hypothetical protein EDD15DRAFT_2373882 [Pisolithus albus]